MLGVYLDCHPARTYQIHHKVAQSRSVSWPPSPHLPMNCWGFCALCGAQIAVFWSDSEVRAGYNCVVLLPFAVLVRGVGHRGWFELEIRQLESNPDRKSVV